MKIRNNLIIFNQIVLSLFLLVTFAACSNEADTTAVTAIERANTEENKPAIIDPNEQEIIRESRNQFEIGNKRYLFDVSTHSLEELRGLLSRIEEITEASPDAFDELEMVMILHGPDIHLFTQKNYEENKQLVDLAAKLDAFKVVDMKACETSMNSLGGEKDEIPEFIELVPYAPDTLKALKQKGYINL